MMFLLGPDSKISAESSKLSDLLPGHQALAWTDAPYGIYCVKEGTSVNLIYKVMHNISAPQISNLLLANSFNSPINMFEKICTGLCWYVHKNLLCKDPYPHSMCKICNSGKHMNNGGNFNQCLQ